MCSMFGPSVNLRLVATQCGLVCLDRALCGCETTFPGDSQAAWILLPIFGIYPLREWLPHVLDAQVIW